MNAFVVSSSQMINDLVNASDAKLMTLHHKMNAVSLRLQSLEAKLDSAGVNAAATSAPATSQDAAAAATATQPAEQQPASAAAGDGQNAPQQHEQEQTSQTGASSDAAEGSRVMDNPDYARFLKMVKMGVPEQAVKNKMAIEGFDPDLLDTPEAFYAGGGGNSGGGGGGGDDDSSSGASST